MKNVVLISGHLFESRRKAGFHLIANAFSKLNYEVVFVTAPYSLLFKLKNHYFNDFNVKKNQLVFQESNTFSYVHATPFHIANFRLGILNSLSSQLYKVYQTFSLTSVLKNKVIDADFIIFESTPGLFLFDKLRKLNPEAKFIYRVSDDLELLGVHPSLIRYENKVLSQFDLVSVPSKYIFDKLKEKNNYSNIKLQYHGIDKKLYLKSHKNPYDDKSKNAVFIGITKLDYDFLEKVSQNFKEINFHIIGPLEKKIQRENIVYYGEIPFEQTVPYVKHADIGLHTLAYSEGAESFTDSLKVHQYTFCGLPIVAPEFLKTERINTFYYSKKDYLTCIHEALDFKKKQLGDAIEVSSWDDLRNDLMKG